MTKEPLNFLQQLSTDEYAPAPHSRVDSQVISRTGAMLKAAMARYRLRPQQLHQASATAAGLMALNEEYGHRYYEVDPDAVVDDSTAAAAFASEALVIDVQTHFMAPHGMRACPARRCRTCIARLCRAGGRRWMISYNWTSPPM